MSAFTLEDIHPWIVGYTGDKNSTEVEVKGQKFLTIPYMAYGEHDNDDGIAFTDHVYTKIRDDESGIRIRVELLTQDENIKNALVAEYLAENCRITTPRENIVLAENAQAIADQLKLSGDIEITCDDFTPKQLPVLRPRASSGLDDATMVFLIAARRAPKLG